MDANQMQRMALIEALLGAEPTADYMRGQRNREYDQAMVDGMGTGMGLGLTGLMAFPGPGGVVGRSLSRFVGAPVAGALSASFGLKAADHASRARAYDRALKREERGE